MSRALPLTPRRLCLLALMTLMLPFDGTSFCPLRRRAPRNALVSLASLRVVGEGGAPSVKNNSKFLQSSILGPSPETKPDYDNIVGPLGRTIDTALLILFRKRLAENVGFDSKLPNADYRGVIEIALNMNKRFSDRREIHKRAQATLVGLFPKWILDQYIVMFAKPFPSFSAQMNAWATYVFGQWLMGECQVNDVEGENGELLKDHGLLVKRCRYLEESGCASICVNGCKIPTQNFFMQNLGVPLTMEPDYETFECQFSFGRVPSPETELLAASTPCLSRCPTAGALRKQHNGELVSLTMEPCQLMRADGGKGSSTLLE